MSAARPAPLTLLAAALTVLALAGALFALYVHPAYAQENSEPAKPTGLSATASHDQVVLTWNDPGDDSITGYVILRRDRDTDEKGHFDELVADTGSADTTYTDTEVAAETRYTYRIKATNEHGTSERSRWYHIDTPAAPEPAANSPATGAPTITGTVQMGETLTADTSGIADADGLSNVQYEYQWLADDAEIAGATNSTYTPAAADEGKAIRMRVSFTDDAGNDETLTSAATDVVAAAEPAELPDKPTGLEATVSPGQVVLAWNDPDDESITGYVILRRVRVNDQGGDFSVLVANTESAATTYTDNEVAASTTYTYRIKAINEHGVSERSRWYHIDTPAAPEPPANSPATGAPTITGTVQVGETLTVNTSGITDEDGLEDAAFSYQWQTDGTAISGATSSAYTPVEADEGRAVTVQVNFTDDAGHDETLTSAPTAAVAAAEPTEPPAKPRDLSATATHNQVVLTWDNPQDDSITGYVILRRIPGVDPEGQFSELVSDTGTAATTYTDASVSAETRYTYRIKAINQHGASERSRWYHIDTPAAPEPETDPADLAPTGLAAALTGGQVVLTWNAPAEDAGSVTGYEILRAEGEDAPVTLTADTGSAATTYTDATATTASESYTYSVKAIRDEERSQTSNAAAVQLPPAVPTGVLSAAAHDWVMLSWNDPQDSAITGYRILRRGPDADDPGEFMVLTENTGSADTGYTDTTVEAERSYVYRVQAIGPGGLSGPSPDLAVNTPPAPVVVVVTPADPQAPSNLAAELADGQVVLNWDAPAQDAGTVTGYEVLRAEGQGELATLASNTGNAGTTYTDATVTSAGASYAYRVKAIRDGERSGASNEARALLKPAIPTGLTAGTVAHNSVTLTWDEPNDDEGITGYAVVRWTLGYNTTGFVTIAADTGTADPSYTDETVEPENEYLYHVKAINTQGESKQSEWLRVHTPAAPDGQPPAAPQQVLSGAGHDRVLLHWADPQDDSITGYRILRAGIVDGVQGEFAALIQDTGNADTSYTDETVEPETSYVYRVLAINPDGVSEPSRDVEVRTSAPVGPQEPPRAEPANVSEGGTDCPHNTTTTCEVDVGGSVTGTLGSLDRDWFKVELEADTRYQIDVEGADTGRGTLENPAAALFDTSSTNLGANNDSGVGENARLIYTPTASDTYYVQASNVSAVDEGTYTLSVIVLGANGNSEADTDFPNYIPTDGRVDVGASATGTFAGHDRDFFGVDLEAGKTYQIDLEGADTGRGTVADPRVSLLDASRTEVGLDDNSGVGKNARMIHTPTAAGTYYLQASGRDGTYTLSVREVPPPDDSANVSEGDTDLPADTTTSGRVQVGGSVTGEIDSETDKDWFKVELEAGKTYQFDMEGKSHKRGIPTDPIRGTLTDTFLLLYNGSGTIITYNDDRYNGDIHLSFNSRIIHTATAAGAHYLEARGSVGRMGSYTLSARELRQADRVTPPDDPDQPPVDPNRPQATLHLSDANPFEGSPPVTVTATVSPASSVPFTVEVSATPASPDGDFGDFYGPAQEDDFRLSTNRTLSFAADATTSTGTVTIRTLADGPAEPDVPEPHERVTVSGAVSGEGITDPDDITLTIINDDREAFDIWVSVPATVNEDAGTATVTYTLRTRQNGPPVIGSDNMYYVLEQEGTATLDDDYTRPDGKPIGNLNVLFDAVPVSAFSPSATRPVWEVERTFTIGIVDDTDEEPNETIVFRVRAGSSRYQSIKRTITILDDDTTPTVAIRAVNRETIEGGDARFTLARTGSKQDSLIVRVTISEEDDRDLLASGVQTEQFISIRRDEAKATFTLDVRDNVSGSRDGDITAEIAQTSASQYEIGSPSSATVTVEHATHSHPRFSHSHSHYRGGYYDQIYPYHSHGSHTHGDTGNRHSETMLLLGVLPDLLDGVEAGQHVHHEEGGYVYQGPNLRKHDEAFHVHICRDIRPGCYSSDDFISGRYGGVLPREVYHQHSDAEPGHGYNWPDLRANGNSPAEGHVYIGGVWRVQVGDTISADTWRVSDPDGMSNAELRYQWLADYTEIRGATGVSYTATEAVVGKKLRVKVTFTDDAGHEEVLRSRATLKVKAAETEADDE